MELELKKISIEEAIIVRNYLESIDYNESYIAHFLEYADQQDDPKRYIKLKFPDIEWHDLV